MRQFIWFILAITFCASKSHAQEKFKTSALRIVYSGSDLLEESQLNKGVNEFNILKIIPRSFSFQDSITVRYEDASGAEREVRIAITNIWGYSNKDGIAYRYYRYPTGSITYSYKVLRVYENIVIYWRSGRFGTSAFSYGFDGDLYPCNMKNLRERCDPITVERVSQNEQFVNKYFKFF
jgi:hypothetical protein